MPILRETGTVPVTALLHHQVMPVTPTQGSLFLDKPDGFRFENRP